MAPKWLPWWLSVKNPPANAGGSQDGRFDPWVRKIPWRKAWKHTPAFLPGKSSGQKCPAGCIQSIGSQRVRHDWSDLVHILAWHLKFTKCYSFSDNFEELFIPLLIQLLRPLIEGSYTERCVMLNLNNKQSHLGRQMTPYIYGRKERGKYI